MNKWDKRYLDLAMLVASWSKDPSTKVGSCIIDENGNPVAFGFNGFPRGLNDTEDRLHDRTFKYAHTLHAEENCMLFSNRTYLEGCTIYISHPPCTKCLSVMKQRKLTKVVCYSGNEDFRSRWGDNSDTLDLSEELGIEVKIYQN